MQQLARGDTVDVGEATIRIGLKIKACNQREQAAIGTARELDGQRVLIEGFDIAGDETVQHRAKAPLLRLARAQALESLLEVPEGAQAVVLLQKPRVQIVHISLFE